jgi:hypothetical protein
MKRLLIVFLCLAILISAAGCSSLNPCSEDPNCTRVLFIGNSYTFVNDLPGTFAALAKSGDHRVETGMAAEGGFSLADHVESTATRDKIKSSQWNFVVLQEQSQRPADVIVSETKMYPPARTLVSSIRKNGAEPIFFLTWGHKNGWPENDIPTYRDMQQGLNNGYLNIARELDARVAPVGVAWAVTRRDNPQMNLWQDDGSHPAVPGTYLAACVFYAVIFQESPEGLSYWDGLSQADAEWLQKVAADTVLEDKAKWNLP